MFWRIITESRECVRPGTPADAAYNKVSTNPMSKQKSLVLLMLAANEHSLFEFEKGAEEEETRDPIPLALRPPRGI
jgi:hypothetical protein